MSEANLGIPVTAVVDSVIDAATLRVIAAWRAMGARSSDVVPAMHGLARSVAMLAREQAIKDWSAAEMIAQRARLREEADFSVALALLIECEKKLASALSQLALLRGPCADPQCGSWYGHTGEHTPIAALDVRPDDTGVVRHESGCTSRVEYRDGAWTCGCGARVVRSTKGWLGGE